ERELECLRWVSLGKTAWETATIMGRSQRTVEFHLINATRKLSASNKIHAAVIAVRTGLI
ncbi:helix-turn-helix transcriptional regulator, partial [Escherichia coli]|nr:helix-turn-helix transcriptional regulator [Escherichia coli]